MSDTSKTVSALSTPASAPVPLGAPVGTPETASDASDSAKHLIDGLVHYFYRLDPPIAFEILPSGVEVAINMDSDGVGHYVYFAAVSGELEVFTPVGPVVPENEGDTQIIDYIDGLTETMPVPKVFEKVAYYDMNVNRELGLRIDLPMPRSFSAAAVSDALWLVDWLMGQLEENPEQTAG